MKDTKSLTGQTPGTASGATSLVRYGAGVTARRKKRAGAFEADAASGTRTVRVDCVIDRQRFAC